MLFFEEPKNFNPSFKVSALYIFCNKKILLLKRSMNKKSEPGLWGSPAGKIEKNEYEFDCIIRETKEETGIEIKKSNLKFLKSTFIIWSEVHFIFNIFRYDFDSFPIVNINHENSEYRWINVDEIKNYDLVRDEKECIDIAWNYKE